MAKQYNQEEQNSSIENLNSRLTSAGQQIAANKKAVFWSVGAVLLIGCFVVGYVLIYRNPRLNKSWEAYNNVEITAMANDSLATDGYMKVVDKYSGTSAANVAALSAAERLYDQGKYEEAVKYVKKFSTGDPVLSANALALQGDCYVNLKKYDEALKAYDKAIKAADRNPQIVPRVLMKEANVYDEQKAYDKALACYEEISKEYPQFVLGNGMTMEAYAERERARLGK